MKSSIRVIKRKSDEKHEEGQDSKELKNRDLEKAVAETTREIASTVKSWIDELQKRKRAQVVSLPRWPVIADAANQNS